MEFNAFILQGCPLEVSCQGMLSFPAYPNNGNGYRLRTREGSVDKSENTLITQ